MKSFGLKAVVLPAAVAASLAFAGGQANAQGLFDIIFGGPVRESPKLQGKFPPAPKPRKPSTGGGARISAPTYATYRAPALVKVDFASLIDAPLATGATNASVTGSTVTGSTVTGSTAGDTAVQNASFQPGAAPAFHDALSGLDGYDLFAEPDIGKALVAYYTANPDFIWVSDGEPNARARDAMRVLAEADGYGMTPSDYFVDVPSEAAATDDGVAREQSLIRFEMTLSARVLRYVRDAQNGRIDPNLISTGYYEFPAKPIDLQATLTALAKTDQPGAYLESRHPQNAQYKALHAELASLKASAADDITLDPKLLLKPGESSPELPKLLTLISRNLDDQMGGDYGEVLAKYAGTETYVPDLVPVIEAVQKKAGQKGDGIIGPRTVGIFATDSKADRIAKVEYAMEELRWLPADLGNPYVFINEPAFTASFIEDGEQKLKMRAVVGRVTNQTAFFYNHVQQVDYHPYWGVPQSIIVNEMLPKLRGDPGYLDRAGYEVTDAKGRRIPSSSIDWGAYGAKVPYNIRQEPSEANALGELKLLFPNRFAIYMHDTPQKQFFKQDVRAFSHGCVRLQDPRGMAAAVLGKDVGYIADKLKGGHSSEKVTRFVPVYVAYFTAWPTTEGKVEYFKDIYGRDDRLQQALDATEAVRTPSS